MNRSDISRRDFLEKAVTAGAAGMATPSIIDQPISQDDKNQTDNRLSAEVQSRTVTMQQNGKLPI